MYMVVDTVTDGQSLCIGSSYAPSDVVTGGEGLVHLLPFVEQASIAAAERFIPETDQG